MRDIEIIENLKNKAVFSVQDVERIGEFTREYTKLVLNRLLQRKLIRHITKNTYTLQKDIYVIASNITSPSYISFWSASTYYGLTEQILNTIYIATTRKMKPIHFEGYNIKFVNIKNFFGYKKIRTENGEIFIAEQEKMLIDCLNKYSNTGNFDEIEKIFMKSEISKEKMITYLQRINNISLIKRTGYMLEKYKKIDISKIFKIDRNYIYLNMFSKKYTSLNTKWRVKI